MREQTKEPVRSSRTTVGYGAIYPTSVGGRIVALIVMLVGVGFLAVLTATIASFFVPHLSLPGPPRPNVQRLEASTQPGAPRQTDADQPLI